MAANGTERVASPPPGYYEPGIPIEQVLSQASSVEETEPERNVVPTSTTPPSSNAVRSNSSASTSLHPARSTTNLRNVLPSTPPVVMTWQGDRNVRVHGEPIVVAGPIIYTFSSSSITSMLLVPPSGSIDSRPQYHISFREDYFMPSSFITTIRRGATEHGPYIGEFDLRGTTRSASVRIGNSEKWLGDVLKVVSKGVWRWNFDSTTLFWERRGVTRQCRLGSKTGTFLAKFIPPNYAMRDWNGQVCKLEVHPEGQRHFDEILISGLILERQRVTGGQSDRW